MDDFPYDTASGFRFTLPSGNSFLYSSYGLVTFSGAQIELVPVPT